jgi:NitT/TauT family transport system ATP-binding protein
MRHRGQVALAAGGGVRPARAGSDGDLQFDARGLPRPLSPALQLTDITCTFTYGRDERTYTAVSSVSIEVYEGEFVSVVGPTGCGKSTILNVAAGLLAPTHGLVTVLGEPLKAINRHAGYIFQADALMPWRTALENVSAGLEYRGLPIKQCREEAHRWLVRVGLGAAGDRYPHQLSGGMRKRTSLAQILVLNPRMLLMDEPFSALDIQTREIMENQLLDIWNADRKSVLFITHDLGEAIALSDRVIVFSAGPASHPIGSFVIDLTRPRDIFEVQHDTRFIQLHRDIWETLKGEVLKAAEWKA